MAALLVKWSRSFIIAAYVGKGKPGDLQLFLGQFVEEAAQLINQGVDMFGHFSIRNYILDAPARSMVKCIIGHNGRFSCEK